MDINTNFSISDINIYGGESPFISAVVSFGFPQEFPDGSHVRQIVRVTARIPGPVPDTVADLQEALLEKAKDTLSLALQRAGSTPVSALLSEAADEADQHRAAMRPRAD